MIETSQSVTVRCPIGKVWDYVQDIRHWAELMPGLQDYDLVDDNDSRWTLKVGVGALVRTVRVNVHVDQWDGPDRVSFSYNLQGDPVQGGGAYLAVAQGPHETLMTLAIRVEGRGPMAPMWEAMGAPLLPKFAMAFAAQLRDGVESACGVESSSEGALPTARKVGWLRQLLRALLGRKAA